MTYSRTDTQERKTLIRQTLLFFAAGLGVIVTFMYVLIPIYSKILSITNKPSAIPKATPTSIILPPNLISPYTATNSATISIKGTALPNMTILLGQNGQIGPQTTATASGDFEFDNLTLNSGDNLFIAYAQDQSGARSDGSAPLHVNFTTDAPKLDVTSPTDGTTITQHKQQVISVTGTTDSGNKITINNQFVFVSTSGAFTGQVQLQPGANSIAIKATNDAGNQTEKDVTVNYSP
ncbi:hypothetical protein C5B42_02485 [Candidatus Cerribacteria bacterium 'Amazon FNV 2010 28 9']|uniref:Bacterial Ig-like domain-containing protein n=1 Tax=Candidatus Cerribacteria bacterium 'Amazon FNV 2010 28 9' TaxID=2081795 RepID=A0A317JRN7_9BACT|nr:MAG: hypothetical protein C5B42_02485 [Candidatus Cerribacteria bacterium 'Amazon FNV 2010 28 9']